MDPVTSLKLIARGKLEIADLNSLYRAQASLRLEQLGRGYTWLNGALIIPC